MEAQWSEQQKQTSGQGRGNYMEEIRKLIRGKISLKCDVILKIIINLPQANEVKWEQRNYGEKKRILL